MCGQYCNFLERIHRGVFVLITTRSKGRKRRHTLCSIKVLIIAQAWTCKHHVLCLDFVLREQLLASMFCFCSLTPHPNSFYHILTGLDSIHSLIRWEQLKGDFKSWRDHTLLPIYEQIWSLIPLMRQEQMQTRDEHHLTTSFKQWTPIIFFYVLVLPGFLQISTFFSILQTPKQPKLLTFPGRYVCNFGNACNHGVDVCTQGQATCVVSQ